MRACFCEAIQEIYSLEGLVLQGVRFFPRLPRRYRSSQRRLIGIIHHFIELPQTDSSIVFASAFCEAIQEKPSIHLVYERPENILCPKIGNDDCSHLEADLLQGGHPISLELAHNDIAAVAPFRA
ncbi:MAG: hypothetical protein K0Q74_1439 [Gammaproteobacteria bacterium]|nr:hypothetical protein [Gammaproteobacteria bacterium]